MRSKWNGEPPYREIDFGFVFVRAVRAGEAKLRGRARESLLWLRRGRTKCLSSGERGPAVSRRCPAGVPVSRWCENDSETDNEIDCEIDSEIDREIHCETGNETDSEIDWVRSVVRSKVRRQRNR